MPGLCSNYANKAVKIKYFSNKDEIIAFNPQFQHSFYSVKTYMYVLKMFCDRILPKHRSVYLGEQKTKAYLCADRYIMDTAVKKSAEYLKKVSKSNTRSS